MRAGTLVSGDCFDSAWSSCSQECLQSRTVYSAGAASEPTQTQTHTQPQTQPQTQSLAGPSHQRQLAQQARAHKYSPYGPHAGARQGVGSGAGVVAGMGPGSRTVAGAAVDYMAGIKLCDWSSTESR